MQQPSDLSQQPQEPHKLQSRNLRHRHRRQKRLAELYTDPGIQSTTSHHALLIDAGSTGSRLHLYEFSDRIPRADDRWTDRLRPGLSELADIEDDEKLYQALKAYLEPFCDFATTVLHAKQSEWHDFPLYLRATAGIRVLPTASRERLMKMILQVLQKEWPFRTNEQRVTILSGEQEALFDWMAVNYVIHGQEFLDGSAPTIGALDLGGASTQIAFQAQNLLSNWIPLTLPEHHYDIYAHSFLMFGMKQAMQRYSAYLKETDPCMPRNMSIDTSTAIDVDHGMEEWSTIHSSERTGDYNERKCFETVLPLLHPSSWCDFAHQGDCSFAGIYQPPIDRNMEFVAFSGYYRVWEFLGLPERSSIVELERATKRVCGLTAHELRKHNDKHAQVSEDELPTYCFQSVYAYHLLKEGYGFKDDHIIRVVRSMDNRKVDWAMGAMLYELHTDESLLIQPEDEYMTAKVSPFRSCLVLMSMALLVCSLWRHYRRHQRRSKWQPIDDEAIPFTIDV